MPKNADIFSCEKCNFKCCKESNYKAHLMTLKHKKYTNVYQSIQTKSVTGNALTCVCMKTYATRMGLWKHKQKCQLLKEPSGDSLSSDLKDMTTKDKDDIIIKLLKDNEEIRQILKEVIPKMGNNTTINNNTTNNNTLNNFNLNFFLNEQCKDALNISEFVESLKITFDDLLYSKKNGLVQGISNVMIRGLKELDIYKRPIHCTDKKRETMYIKDNTKWEKDETHEKMKNTIIQIAKKERNALTAWVEENPNWMETESKQIEYLTIMRNVCEPIEDYDKNNKKIIRTLTTNVFVDKCI